jgi:branched-subunit amino acid aminotransferase/4-amino-4-deoxychorismate lyase
VAWVDGRFVAPHEACVPVGDAGFVLGTTVTEQMRTFHGRTFLAAVHARRFRDSLQTVGITLDWTAEELFSIAAEVAARYHAAEPAGSDLGVIVFATPGNLPAQHQGRAGRPRVMIHAFPLAFASWAAAYEAGLSLRVVSTTQVPAVCWPVALKCRSRMHYHLADREAHLLEQGARALLLHVDGRVSEPTTANVAIVRDGVILTPPTTDALAGVSLGHLRGLAAAEGIDWRETSLRATDLVAADEILLTSTPSCLLPVTRFDGRVVGTGLPGKFYRGLLAAWSRGVGLDIAHQARAAVFPGGDGRSAEGSTP